MELAAETDAETSSRKAVMLVDVVVARVIGEGMPWRDPAHDNSVELFLCDVLRTYGLDVACRCLDLCRTWHAPVCTPSPPGPSYGLRP